MAARGQVLQPDRLGCRLPRFAGAPRSRRGVRCVLLRVVAAPDAQAPEPAAWRDLWVPAPHVCICSITHLEIPKEIQNFQKKSNLARNSNGDSKFPAKKLPLNSQRIVHSRKFALVSAQTHLGRVAYWAFAAPRWASAGRRQRCGPPAPHRRQT